MYNCLQISVHPWGSSSRVPANTVDGFKRRKLCHCIGQFKTAQYPKMEPKEQTSPPWAFGVILESKIKQDLAGFQLNERYLNWDVAAQTQLLKLACADRLGLDLLEIDGRITEISSLVPDLRNKLGRMKADVLCALLENPEQLAHRLSSLREMLPTTNVSKLVSTLPSLILDYEPESLASRIEVLRAKFGDRTDVEFLIAREPNLLKVAQDEQSIESLLQNVKRLLPVADSIGFVIGNPSMVLDMDTGNLPSAIDGDLTQ